MIRNHTFVLIVLVALVVGCRNAVGSKNSSHPNFLGNSSIRSILSRH